MLGKNRIPVSSVAVPKVAGLYPSICSLLTSPWQFVGICFFPFTGVAILSLPPPLPRRLTPIFNIRSSLPKTRGNHYTFHLPFCQGAIAIKALFFLSSRGYVKFRGIFPRSTKKPEWGLLAPLLRYCPVGRFSGGSAFRSIRLRRSPFRKLRRISSPRNFCSSGLKAALKIVRSR